MLRPKARIEVIFDMDPVSFSFEQRQRAKRTDMLPQFRVRLHFRTIHGPVFNWLFGAGLLWRGYTAVVGGIIVVAVWTTDRGGSAVIAGSVISTPGGSTDRSSTNSGSTDADRHSRAYTTVEATTVNATAIDTAAVDTAAICGGVS